jgi:tetratricopeptide (TPR) repeat protein
MKKTVLLFSLMFTLALGAFAQNSNINKADRALKEGNLTEAKQFIDEAAADEKTATDPRMMYTRAQIYQAISTDESTSASEQEAARNVAIELYDRLIATEKENSTYYILATEGKKNFYGVFFNKGVDLFNENEFEQASTYFRLASQIVPDDTTAILYAGYSAQNSDNWDVARESYEKLVELGTKDLTVFKTLVYIYRAIQPDADRALMMINKAREIDPGDSDLTREMVNILIELERMDEALAEMEAAVKIDPNNDVYHLNIGILYDNKGDFDKAMVSYNKALELAPDNFEANFNVGAIYYNEGAELIQTANNMGLEEYQEKGKALEDEAKKEFEKALPFLEKANKARPDDIQTIQTLVTIYGQLGNTAKVEEMTAKLNALLGDG